MAVNMIQRNISDIKYIDNIGTTKFTLGADSGVNVVSAGYVSEPSIPSGYTRILWGARANGDSSVVTTGINSYWIVNTKTSTSMALTATTWAIVIKYGS